MTSISVQLPDDIGFRLQNLADETGRTQGSYVLEALERHLEDLEDLYLARKALEDVRAGRSRTYTLEEVEEEFGLAR